MWSVLWVVVVASINQQRVLLLWVWTHRVSVSLDMDRKVCVTPALAFELYSICISWTRSCFSQKVMRELNFLLSPHVLSSVSLQQKPSSVWSADIQWRRRRWLQQPNWDKDGRSFIRRMPRVCLSTLHTWWDRDCASFRPQVWGHFTLWGQKNDNTKTGCCVKTPIKQNVITNIYAPLGHL